MSDVNANIGIHFDTADALAQLRQLQAGLSKFNQALTEGNVAAANAQKGLNAQLVQSINATGKFVASQKTITSSTTAFTDALEKNKLSMGQYFKFTAAAATQNSKVFSNAFKQEKDILNRAMKDRVKSLQTQYIQLTNANGELVKVLQVVPKHLKMINGQYADYTTRVQMAAQRQQMLNQLIKQGSTQLLNFGKNTQWAGRQLMVGLTIPLSMLGSVAAKSFREMEQATIKFSRVYGDMLTSIGDTDKAIADIQRLAKEFTKFGIAATDTMNMAADAAAMGLTGAALQAQVTNATKLAVLGQVSQQQALETTISLQNAFGISSEDLGKKINFLNAVENQTVLSIEDLTIAIPKAAPVVKQLGGNVEDLAFFLTAMKEGGINASEGANALKSGLASMINPSKKASDMLSKLGINIKGIVDVNAGDIKGTVVGLARALDTLAPLERSRAIETMFGKFQFARISTLFQNITKEGSQASKAFQLAGASVEELAILSERELGKVENAVGVKFQKQLENLKLQLMPLGKAFLQAVTPVVQFASKLLEKFNNLSDGTKKFVVGFIAIIGGIAPVALMTVGLVANGVANLIKFFGMLRGGMAKLNGQNNVLGGGFDYLTQAEIDNLTQSNALHGAHQDLISTFNVEKTSVDLLATAYQNAASQARALASGSPGLFNASPGAKGAVSGLPKKFASGGFVPGTGNGDTIPALLTPGEFVVTKDDVKKHPELIAMFSSGRVQKFAEGGYAGKPITSSQSAYVAGLGVPASAEYEIAKQLDFINKASSDKLLAYAKATGKVVTDSSQATLESLRTELEADFKKIINSVVDSAKASGRKIVADTVSEPLKKVGTGGSQSSLHSFYNPRAKQQYKDQFGHAEESNSLPIDKLESVAKITNAKTQSEIVQIIKDINAHNEANGTNVPMPTVGPVSGFGYKLQGQINKSMADGSGQIQNYKGEGQTVSTIDAFLEDFQSKGVKKWAETIKIGGGNFEQLSGAIKEYDDGILSAVQKWKANNPGKAFTDADFAAIETTVRNEVAGLNTELGQVFEEARKVVTGVRLYATQEQKDILNKAAVARGETHGTKNNQKPYTETEKKYADDRGSFQINSEKRTSTGHGQFIEVTPEDEALAAKEGAKVGQAAVDGVRGPQGTDSASPSKKGRKAGKEVADGIVQGLQDGEVEVASQASKLGSSAVPTASETQAKVGKMDLTNKAFYDDLNNPEDMDLRQSLKSQDRQRRKLGATRTVDAAYTGTPVVPVSQSSSISITNNQTTINAAQAAAEKAMADAAQAEEVAAKLRIEAAKWQETAAREGKKGTETSKNAEALKKQADEAEKKAAQARIKAAEEQARAAAVAQNNGSDGSIEAEVAKEQQGAVEQVKAHAKEAGKTRKAQEDATKATQETARAQKKTAAQAKNSSKNSGGKSDSSVALKDAQEETAQTQEQINEAKQKELAAASQVTAATERQANGVITNAELVDATQNSLRDSAGNAEEQNAAEEQALKDAQDEAALNDQINAEKERQRQLLAEYNAKLAAEAAGTPIIPAGTQSGQIPSTALSAVDAYEEASTYTRDKNGQILFDPELGPNGEKNPTTLTEKQITKKKRGMRREKVGKFSGKASGALGVATMVAGAAGAPPQVTAALGAASTVAQFAPMLAGMGPVGWAAAGIMAVGAGAYMLNQHFNKMAAEAAKFVTSTSATRDSMKKMGELTGKVGASEIMDRRRSSSQYGKYNESYKVPDQFGKKFMSSDLGKDTKKTFKENLAKYGDRKATDDLALKLASQVADGVLTGAQAESIAQALALSLKNQKVQMQVTGKMRTLLGPNGENLKDQPLSTRLNLIANARLRSQDELKTIKKKGDAGESQRTAIARLASYDMNNLEMATMMADQVQFEYETQRKKLEVEIASTTNLEKKKKLQDDLNALNVKGTQDAQVMNNTILSQLAQSQTDFNKFYSGSTLGGQATREDAFFDASRSNVTEAYKGTAQEKSAKTFLNTTKNLEAGATTGILNQKTGLYEKNGLANAKAAQGFQAKMEMLVGSKVLSPDEANSYMKMFTGNLGALDTLINVGISAHGIGKTKELMNMFAGFGNKKLAQSMVQNILVTKKDPAAFDATMEALKNIQSLDGTTIDMEILLKGGPQVVEELKRQQDVLEKLKEDREKKAKKTGKKATAEEVLADAKKALPQASPAIAALEKNTKKMEKFRKLTEDQRTEYLQKLAIGYQYENTLNEKQLAEEADNYVTRQMITNSNYNTLQQGTQAYIDATNKLKAAYLGMDAATRAETNLDIGVVSGIDSKTPGKDGTGGGGNRDTTYDDLMKRLRNVRLAALNAAGGFSELKKALADTGVKAIKDQFNGLETQLVKLGKTAQFTDYLAGLDQAELNKFGKAATKKGIDPNTGKKDKNVKVGDFILNDKGKKMEAGFAKAIMGDYYNTQLKSVALDQQQIKAKAKMVALGMNQADIETMLADENFRALVAAGKITDAELKTNAALTAQARIRSSIDALYNKGQTDKTTADNQKKIPQVVQWLQQANMSAEAIQSAISDPEMLNNLIAGIDNFDSLAGDAKVKFQQALDFINAIPDNKMVNIVFNQTEEQKKMNAADAATQMLDAYKSVDEHTLKNTEGNTYAGLQVQMDNLNNQAKIAQDAINLTQSKIDTMQQDVDKDQRAIETNFTRPIEAKNRAIEKLNRTAEMSYTRPIQALQERAGILSHDLELMNHAAEAINEKYDKQQEALQKVSEINQQIIQQQQQQLGLADALTQGDISAAAKAVQDMRASNAANYAGNADKALQQARSNEINGLKGAVSGKTQKEIADEQWQIGLDTYALEQKKAAVDKEILVIQDQIYALEQQRQAALDAIQVKTDAIAAIQYGTLLTQQNDLKAITDKILPLQQQSDILFKMIADNDASRKILGFTRTDWGNIKSAAEAHEKLLSGDLARALAAFNGGSNAAADAWTSIKDDYNSIIDKSVTLKQYVETIYGPNAGQQNPGTQNPGTKNPQGPVVGQTQYNGSTLETWNGTNWVPTASYKAPASTGSTGGSSGGSSGTSGSSSTSGASTAKTGSGSSAGNNSVPTYATADAARAAATATKPSATASAEGAYNAAVAAAAKKVQTASDAAFAKNNSGAAAQAAAVAAATAATVAAAKAASAATLARFGGNAIAASQFGNWSTGGLIPQYLASGGFAIGTDTVPAMLTPGEFIMSRYAVNTHGVDTMKAMNAGAKPGDSVYNYNLSVNVKSDANPDEIARTVMTQIRQIDSQRIRGNRL